MSVSRKIRSTIGTCVFVGGLAAFFLVVAPAPTTEARVTFSPSYMGAFQKVRPSAMHGGSDFGWVKMRWSKWNNRVAKGRGIYYYTCKYDERVCPGEYRKLWFRVKVKLYRPRMCRGSKRFTRMFTAYKGPLNVYSPRRRSVSRHDCFRSATRTVLRDSPASSGSSKARRSHRATFRD